MVCSNRFGGIVRLLCTAVLLFLFSYRAQAVEPEGRPVRILAIGNSFSADAVEQNLHELAAADGVPCEIGNMFIGGCSLERHVANIRSDAGAYDYCKIDAEGGSSQQSGVSIREALCDGKWDFVSVQQVSQLSGVYESYTEWLPELIEYIKKYAPDAEIVLHQTWAYAQNSDHFGFVTYGSNQSAMYEAIADVSRRVATEFGIGRVIPAGTAIQNARQTEIGDNLNRDGYHLNALGKFTAACAWYETLFGADVRKNGYFCCNIYKEHQRMAKSSAHAAVESPFSLSE